MESRQETESNQEAESSQEVEFGQEASTEIPDVLMRYEVEDMTLRLTQRQKALDMPMKE